MSELEKLAQDMEKVAKELEGGKATKAFMRKEGRKLKNKTIKQANRSVGKVTGNYLKSIKNGKVYNYKKQGISIDAYSSSGVAHLIEDGHIIKGKKKGGKEGEEKGFKRGYHVFDKAAKGFQDEFVGDIEEFQNDIFKKNGF